MITALLILPLLLGPDTPAPAAKVAYYFGESKVSTVDGKPLGVMVSLVKREVKPAESTIVETVLVISSRPQEPIKEHVATLAVDGATFTSTEQGGAFTGTGQLIGKPWEWAAWTSTSKLALTNGGSVVSRDRVTDRGLSVSKDVLGPDGVVRVKIAEDLATIDGATYELLHAKLAPKAPR